MYITKYLVIVDLDEIIVPMKYTKWAEIIDQQSLRLNTSAVGSYSFRCVFFRTEWPSDQTYLNNTLVTKYNIQTLLKTKREKKLFYYGERSKLMVIPERIWGVCVHTVLKYWKRKYWPLAVPYDEAMMFHFRNCEKPNDTNWTWGQDACTRLQMISYIGWEVCMKLWKHKHSIICVQVLPGFSGGHSCQNGYVIIWHIIFTWVALWTFTLIRWHT